MARITRKETANVRHILRPLWSLCIKGWVDLTCNIDYSRTKRREKIFEYLERRQCDWYPHIAEVISLYMYRLCKSRGLKWLSWVTEDKFGDKFGFSREFKAENEGRANLRRIYNCTERQKCWPSARQITEIQKFTFYSNTFWWLFLVPNFYLQLQLPYWPFSTAISVLQLHKLSPITLKIWPELRIVQAK